jgi:hypothetical protein
MTIEDRVRQLLADAVANEPPPRGTPLDHALGRRRPRPVLAGAVAVLVVLALVVAVAAVRGTDRPATGPTATTTVPATTISTTGWLTYLDRDNNLRLRYPPGWKLRPGPLGDELVPPEYAGSRPGRAKYAVTIAAFPGFYPAGYDWQEATRGRLPGGQAYLHMLGYPDLAPGEDPPAAPASAPGRRYAVYMVDWGRFCSTKPKPFCGAHALRVAVYDANARAFDRYRAQLDTIVQSARHLRPAPSSTDDANRPACRPEQWRLDRSQGLSGSVDDQQIAVSGTVRYRAGPACALRLTLQVRVERDGRLLPVTGNPSTATVQGLLPEDDQRRLNRLGVHSTPLMWQFTVDEWCNRDLADATLRVTTEGGREVEAALPDMGGMRATRPVTCQQRGRPAGVTGLP